MYLETISYFLGKFLFLKIVFLSSIFHIFMFALLKNYSKS